MPSPAVLALRARYALTRGAGQAAGPIRKSLGQGFTGAILGPPLAALETIGNVVSRPQAALSEAYGAYEAGKNPLRAGLRGLQKGYEGAQYPTFGEQFVPPQEGEGFGRKLERFAVDVATDPLTWIGPGLVEGAGKAGLKGARLVGGSKIAKALAETPVAKGFSQFLLGTDYNIARYGGEAGVEAVTRAGRGVDFGRRLTALGEAPVEEAIKRLRVNPNDEAFWAKVTDAIRAQDYSGLTPESQMATIFRRGYDDWYRRVSRFVDDFGDEFEVYNPSTKKSVPFRFAGIENYDPQFVNPEHIGTAMSAEGYSKKVKELASRMRITETEADDFLRFQTGNPRKFGPLEYARRGDLPDDWLDKNALRNFLRYNERTAKRYAMAQEFGVKNRRLDELLESASRGGGVVEGSGAPKRAIDAFRKGVQGRYEPTPLAGVAPTLLGYQVLNKLGPTSVIYQLGQHANIVVAKGVGEYIKGWVRFFGDKALRQRSAMAVHGALQSQMEQLLGRAAQAEGISGLVPKIASKYLGAIGFKWADALPRRIGFAGAVATAEARAGEALAKGLGLTPELRKMGITARELSAFEQAGKFLPETEAKIGLRAAKYTQFEPNFLSLPPLWQSPEMRVAMQFRSFINEQTRFLYDAVMKPAIEYLDTNGKSGDIRPMIRALIAFPVAGQGVAAAREAVRMAAARVTGAHPKKRKPLDPEGNTMEALKQMVRDSLYVGAFGIAGDILDQAARGNLVEWLAGPTIGDVANVVEGLTQTGAKSLEGKPPTSERLIGTATRYGLFRRLLPIGPTELARGVERKYLR